MALKQAGPATIAELAGTLRITGEAVRQQLLQLRQEGWIEVKQIRAEDRNRVGRPATRYRLSEAGDDLFPKHYDALTIEMMDAIAETLGQDAMAKVLAKVTDDRVKEIEPRLTGLALEEKISALKSLYLQDDPFMTTEVGESGYRLVERNCPFLHTAMRRPAYCSISVNALTRLLGVRVRRDEKFQNGDGRCVFRIHPDQPIDSTTWQFTLE